VHSQQTLVFVPALYTILDDFQELVLSLVGRVAKPRQLQPSELAILRPNFHPQPNLVALDDETPEAIALRDNLRDAARAVIGQLRPQDLEVVVAALYDVQRPPLLAAAFRKRLQRAVANTRTLWKRRHGDDRTG